MNLSSIRVCFAFSHFRAQTRNCSPSPLIRHYLHTLRYPSDSEVNRMQWDREREALKHRQGESSQLSPRTNNKHKLRLRGHPKDEADVRISKTLSWLLRHGAKKEGLTMRPDGYVRVHELLALPRMKDVDFKTLERIVQHDVKERYHLLLEAPESDCNGPEGCWSIRANQGHSIKDVDLQLGELTDAGQVAMAVHGTTKMAWAIIQKEGLSPMKRTHIHLAQHTSHIKGAKASPGLRSSPQILIYIDLDRALHAGIPFFLSANGVVLSKGDESGYLRPEFFKRVTDAHGDPLPGWSTADNSNAGENNCVCIDAGVVGDSSAVSGGGSDSRQASSMHLEAQPDSTHTVTIEHSA